MDPRSVLILSNDLVGLDELCEELRNSGFAVWATYEPKEALGWAQLKRFDLAIVNLDFLEERKTAEELRSRNPGIFFIILSGASKTPSTIAMVEALGGAVLRDRMITHRELRDLVLGLLDRGSSPGPKETIRRS